MNRETWKATIFENELKKLKFSVIWAVPPEQNRHFQQEADHWIHLLLQVKQKSAERFQTFFVIKS